MKVPYATSTGNLTAEVHLQRPAEVYLVNSSNFYRYQLGEEYYFHGGYYDYSPVQISVTGRGRWYLIVKGSSFKYRFLHE